MNGHFSCVDEMPDNGFTTPCLTISTSMQSPTLSKSVDYRPNITVRWEDRDAFNNYSDGTFYIEPRGDWINLVGINEKLSTAENDGYKALHAAFSEIYKINEQQGRY